MPISISKDMKILVTGSNGLLGRKLLADGRSGIRMIPTARTRPIQAEDHFAPLDVTDAPQVTAALHRIRPDWVVHTAAFTDVDRCEVDRELAHRVNLEGTRNVARACSELGIGLVTLSTDYVFDGTAGPYGEEDGPNPLSYYGWTKLEAEREVLTLPRLGNVVRTIVLFGSAPGVRPNFVTWLIQTLRQGKPVRIVTDQWGTPTLADDLATFLVDLCLRDGSGLFHFAGADLMTRYEMALRVSRQFDLDENLITPILTDDLAQIAPRPRRSGLKTDLVRGQFQVVPRPFEESLSILAGQLPG